jgi:signal transduction histidine kinase
LHRTRRYAHDSFPVELSEIGLKNSIETLCSDINKQSKCECALFWSAGDILLDQNQNINVYRIIQEALQNAVKHSKASRITVETSREDSRFSVTVQDNGTGNPNLNDDGLGLRSMRYRAHQIGAEYLFESYEVGGTTVKIKIQV